MTVVVPSDEEEESPEAIAQVKAPEARQSILTQAKLAEIGATMDSRYGCQASTVPACSILSRPPSMHSFVETLPLNTTKRRSIRSSKSTCCGSGGDRLSERSKLNTRLRSIPAC